MSAAVEISAALAAGRLLGTAAVLDAEEGGATVLCYTATASAPFGQAPAEPHLVAIALARPIGTVGAPPPDLGIDPPPLAVLALDLDPPPEGQVALSGVLAWCRIVDGAGVEHIRCPLGAPGSGAPIELDALAVFAGGFVRIVGGVFY